MLLTHIKVSAWSISKLSQYSKKGKKSCQINLSCKSRNIGSHPLNEMAKRVAQNRAHKTKLL